MKEKILLTIAYFNLLRYAPTGFEVWRHLMSQKKENFLSVIEALDELRLIGKISCRDGFWFFPQREILAKNRNYQKKIAVAKIKRMIFWTKIIRYLPFLRAIFVNGTLALGTTKKESDWDVMVITKKKFIWLGRLILIVFLAFFNKRRSGRKNNKTVEDKFCLNHFLTEEGLILEKQNQFVAHEESYTFPLFGVDVYKRFLQLNYGWLKKRRANFEIDESVSLWLKKEKEKYFVKDKTEFFLEKFGVAKILNQLSKKLMLWLITNNPKTNWPKADIRYSDQALIFIPDPRRDWLEKEASTWLKGGE